MSKNKTTNELYRQCKKQGGCVPGDETVIRSVRVKYKGISVEDHRELAVCRNCGVPINKWSGK